MIIVLAAMQLTSNDVHSRLTRRTKGVRPNIQPGDTGYTTTTVPLESMQFADNRAVIGTISLPPAGKTTVSTVSSVYAENGSFIKNEPEGLA